MKAIEQGRLVSHGLTPSFPVMSFWRGDESSAVDPNISGANFCLKTEEKNFSYTTPGASLAAKGPPGPARVNQRGPMAARRSCIVSWLLKNKLYMLNCLLVLVGSLYIGGTEVERLYQRCNRLTS